MITVRCDMKTNEAGRDMNDSEMGNQGRPLRRGAL